MVEPLRTAADSLLAWIARRWDDQPSGVPWFGTQRYWQDRVLELREQVPRCGAGSRQAERSPRMPMRQAGAPTSAADAH